MRFISGLIVGVLLTFGMAYIVDTTTSVSGADGKAARRLVNWDVVNDDMRGLSIEVQDLWAKLVGETKKLDKQVDKRNDG